MKIPLVLLYLETQFFFKNMTLKTTFPLSQRALIIDGRSAATDLKAILQKRVNKLYRDRKFKPGLAVIRIGNDSASAIYVASKMKQCKELGMRGFEIALPTNISLKKILSRIQDINEDPEIHGLVVQLPLPKLLNKQKILSAIDPKKDVDGLHPQNLGLLAAGASDGFSPCTPLGCLHLIHTFQPDLKGLHAVIVGASNLVGKPMGLLLLQQGCTISILNSKTVTPSDIARTADILVVATGKVGLVTKKWIKPGAIVIDVGINKDEKTGSLKGDVIFHDVSKVAGAITPVPGGVGPMTVAYLLSNVIRAAECS